ncbi:MAG TPA: alpha/beta hydrolase [Methylomirabilota bacterium]|nr:alpha/beta hydrolase [Methylomirabilota bacterium]
MPGARIVLLLSVWLAIILGAGAGARAATFDSAGVPIAYDVEGTGPPVILIHGLYASADLNWHRPGMTKRLAGRYQVIALDLRGHGRSGKPSEEGACGRETAEDVVRLMDHLGIAKAHVVGYSLGGMITMRLLADHPDRVRSGTLAGMGWLPEGSRLQAVWGHMLGPQRASTPPACVRSMGALAVTESAVRGITVPVEVIVGDRDPVKRMYVAPLARVRPDWRVVEIDEAGHLTCIVKPAFHDAVARWLDTNARR